MRKGSTDLLFDFDEYWVLQPTIPRLAVPCNCYVMPAIQLLHHEIPASFGKQAPHSDADY